MPLPVPFGTTPKWTSITAGIWIQSTIGSAYCFSLYSPLLKSSQSYSQSTLDSIACCKDVGANVGVLAGLLYSSAGPTAVILAAALQCFAGYLLIWMSVVGILPRPPPALMGFYMFLAAHSQPFFNTADVVVAAENFPASRGTVIGIMKGFLGLSGAILIQISRTFFNGNASSFILMLALLPPIVSLLLMYYVQIHHDPNNIDDKRHLDAFSLIALITAAYLMSVMIIENVLTLGSSARFLTFIVLMLLLISPLTVVARAHLSGTSNTLPDCPSVHETERKPLIDDGRSSRDEEKTSLKHRDTQILYPRGDNLNLFQAMQTCDFWLLFVAMSCGMGSGLATVNNLSQIGSSLGYSSLTISTLISLWSIWNFLGRFGSGYGSDYILHRRGWARPLFIAVTLGIMSLGHLVISTGLPGSLHVGSILVGVCYGSQWALMPSVTSEVFGLRHFGTIFNSIAVASPIGSYIFSVRIVGYIYDMQSAGSKTCIGRNCFMLSFLIMASVTLVGCVVSFVLFLRTRRFYKQVICPRLRTSAAQ